jgi:hypothetical protein
MIFHSHLEDGEREVTVNEIFGLQLVMRRPAW